jgi:signal transduction histidine kinase/AraC-like DNA-binding protein/streptogramin lyase
VEGSILKYENSGNTEKLEYFLINDRNGSGISKLFVDDDNVLWIARNESLQRYNILTNLWDVDFQENTKHIFRNLQITGIDQDNDGNIWIVTDGKGAFVFEKNAGIPFNVRNIPYKEGSLSSDGLTSIFCDETGIVWIGTAKKGVDFYKKNIRKFRIYRNSPIDPWSLSNNDVDCIREDNNGNLWVGTNGGGLNYLNTRNDKFYHLFPDGKGIYSLSSNIIVTLFEDSDQKLWIGTYLGGLNCFDPLTGRVKVYTHDNSDSTSLSDNRVWGVCEDSHKNIWVATLTSGLNRLDRKTGGFKRFNTGNSSICFDYTNSISVDGNDNFWISTAYGLINFDPLKNNSKCYFHDPANSFSISSNQIISTFNDSRGMFWVCTYDGLNLMDQKNGSFRVFKEKDGLSSASVFRIEEDNDGNLWISSRNGISKLIIGDTEKGEDSLSFRFVNYDMTDGLQGREFNQTASFKTRDGELWFGGPNGLNAFYPQEVKEDRSPVRLVITGLRIDNNVIKYGQKVNGRVLIEKPLFNTDKIVLKYAENSFTIDFVALNYFFPGKSKYAYTLEGFSDKWTYTDGRENFATFSNVKNGNYTFKVKATNSDGLWNDSFITLKVKIMPPVWKSWYAYLIYTVLILSLLILLRYLTLTKERMKMQMVHEHIEYEHIHEMDSLKIKFFTNISHEFRTPLTLIFSPLEELMGRLKNKPEEKYLNLIHQNARRLLFMVNQLLDLRKMEVQGFRYNPSAGDIIAFIRETVFSFKDLSEQKHILLNFHSEFEQLDTLFDRDKMEKIMFNLLSNAFKFTPPGGRITVTIVRGGQLKNRSTEESGLPLSPITINVEDTGIGISAENIDKLFISFYQVESKNSDSYGSGIGLSLVKEFVLLHDGEIIVKSEPGKGSCFSVILPALNNRKALSEDNLLENSSPSFRYFNPSQESGIADSRGEKPTLLIAEDNDDLRFYMKDNLQKTYNICESANGNDAVSLIRKIIPDLIISDIVMPGINGIELCRLVKNDIDLCHIPVILLTALATDEEQTESLVTGADDFIIKPFNFQILETRISNLISTRRNLKQVFRSNLVVGPDEITITSLDEQFINKSIELVELNISNPDYTVEELSRDLGMSRTLFYKKILALTGKTPLEFIRSMRLKRAEQLLQKSQLNVSEIAYRVGFNDPKYFRKHFKNEFGLLPSQYLDKFKQSSDKNQFTPIS